MDAGRRGARLGVPSLQCSINRISVASHHSLAVCAGRTSKLGPFRCICCPHCQKLISIRLKLSHATFFGQELILVYSIFFTVAQQPMCNESAVSESSCAPFWIDSLKIQILKALKKCVFFLVDDCEISDLLTPYGHCLASDYALLCSGSEKCDTLAAHHPPLLCSLRSLIATSCPRLLSPLPLYFF